MKRTFTIITALALCAGVAHAQAPSAPTFDAADISLRPHTGTNSQTGATGGVLRGGRWDFRNASMIDLIQTAYGISDTNLIVGGPSWIEYDRFDIAAKAPQGTSPADIRLMVQAMLADRFKLDLQKETRSMAGFSLTAGKDKHKMKEVPAEGGGCNGNGQPQPNGFTLIVGACKGVTMDSLADLIRDIGGYTDGPVVNNTGLKGYFDFDWKVSPSAVVQRAGADGISMQMMIEQQLGLKLEPGTAPIPVFVVKNVNQKPTANPSGVSSTIPLPPPMEFDVAEIKLSQPDAQTRIRLLPGGRLDADGVTMKAIFQFAWDITTDALVAGTPSWWDDTKYMLVAKTSTAVSGNGQNMNVDVDDLKAMLKQLVVERFKMKSHYEDRAVDAYTLVADKPKMAKADPANRTGFKEGPARGQPDQRNAILGRMVTVKNMTMPQFTEELRRIAGGYVRVPVEDKTGLEGAYDFTLTFTPIGLLQGRGGPAGGGPADGAGDPTGALSLPDAINRQLGLKLEMRKRPMPVLVIDSIQEKPEN